MSGKLMGAMLDGMKNITRLEPVFSIKSSVKDAQLENLAALADAIAASVNG